MNPKPTLNKHWKNTGNLKAKEKPRGNNTNAIKLVNTAAKPMKMWKNEGEHSPTKKKMQKENEKMPN